MMSEFHKLQILGLLETVWILKYRYDVSSSFETYIAWVSNHKVLLDFKYSDLNDLVQVIIYDV